MIYIDVRTNSEYLEEHYPDAINIPVEQITEGVLPNLPRDSEICLYCKSGGRAQLAEVLLKRAGLL